MAGFFAVLIVVAVMSVGLYYIWRVAAPSWREAQTVTDNELSAAVLPENRGLVDAATDRIPPPRLSWNWAAAFLGPLWYLYYGLWSHFFILITIAFLTGGLLAPAVWLYCAVKANEDYFELKKARWSFY